MSIRRLFVLAVALTVLAGPVLAQDAPAPAKEMPKAEAILGIIPAGSMGFALANNVQVLAGNAEKFLNELGLAEMVGAKEPGSLLAMLRDAAQLGAGFNPNGGAAVVMLDPQQFGVDLMALMGMGDQEPPAQEQKVPFVLVLAGTSVKEVFEKYEMAEAGEFTKVNLRMGPMMARKSGSYILLSPDSKFITAMMEAKEKASTTINKVESAALAAGDVGIHINMKVAGPFLVKMMNVGKAMMGSAPGMEPEMAELMKVYFDFYGRAVAQMQSLSLAFRLTPTGVLFEELITFVPDSEYGKMAGLYAAASKNLLAGLPNLPYVLAAGSSVGSEEGRAEAIKFTDQMLDKIMANEALKAVPDPTKARLRKALTVSMQQVESMQFVIGGAPEGSGVFGAAAVCKAKDASALKGAIVDGITAGIDAVKALADDEDAKQLKVTYAKGAETIGSLAVDTITFSHPEMDKMPQDEKDKMTKVLGENQIRIFLAAKDDKTLVVTFGGGKAFLAEALKAADGTGTIPTSPGMAEVMKMMPASPSGLVVFNLGNLMTVIEKATKAVGEEMPPFKFTAQNPIAMGVGVQGSTIHVVGFVPTDVIKDIAGMVMMSMQGGQEPAPGQGPAGKKDF